MVHVDDIFAPQIPTLLPRNLEHIRLTHLTAQSNFLGTALTSLASQEELVYLVLNRDALAEDHRYSVSLTDMGERKAFSVEDSVPCVREPASNRLVPLFTNSEGQDVWALILEKAYAKMFGLYSATLEGRPYELVHSFMDGEYKVYPLRKDKLESIWKFLRGFFDQARKEADLDQVREYMNINIQDRRKVILVSTQPLHAHTPDFRCYIVDAVRELKGPSGGKEKFVKLRLVEEDTFLAQHAREKWAEAHEIGLSMAQQGPGHFWIRYERLARVFSSVSINTFRLINLHEEFVKNVLKLSLDGSHSCVLVSFEIAREEDRLVIGAHQKNRAFFRDIAPDYRYSNLRMVILRLEEAEGVDFEDFPEESKAVFL